MTADPKAAVRWEKQIQAVQSELVRYAGKPESRIKTETALRKSERSIQLWAGILSEVIWTVDPNFQITYVSAGIERLLGYSVEETLGLHPFEMMPSRSVQTILEEFHDRIAVDIRVPRPERKVILELEFFRKDGSTIWMEMEPRFIRDEQRLPVGIIGVSHDITARKAAEKKASEFRKRLESIVQERTRMLQESEILFDRFLNSITDVVYRFDPQANRYDFISPSFERQTGYSLDELRADPEGITRKITHSDDVNRVFHEVYHHISKGPLAGSIVTEYRVVCKDGKTIWVSDYKDFEFTSQGLLSRINGIVRDITEQKRVEGQLQLIHRELEERVIDRTADLTRANERLRTEILERKKVESWLATTLDQSPLPTAVMEADGKVTLMNEALLELIGYEGREYQDIHYWIERFISKDSTRKTIYSILKKALGGEKLDGVQIPLNLKEKGLTTVALYLSLFQNGLIAQLIDVSQRVKMEQALKESEDRFRSVFEHAGVGIAHVDFSGRFLRINKQMQTILGYSRQELSEMHLKKIIQPDATNMVMKMMGEQILFHTPEMRFVRKDGSEIFIQLTISQIYDSKNVPVQFIAVVQDISQRKGAESALRASQTKLSQQNFLLEQKNIALHEVMGQVKAEKERIEKNIQANLDQLIFPLLEKIKDKGTNNEITATTLLEENLKSMTSSFGSHISNNLRNLTNRELEVCNMVKNGYTSKEISRFFNISVRSVENHRNNVRKKLELTNKNINLATYLSEI